MTSIRTKLFRNISLLVLFFVLISWGISTLFLEDFYLWQKKRNIIENARAIDALYTTQAPDVSLELERIGNSLGAGLIIFNQEGYVKYSSFGRMMHHDRLPQAAHSGPNLRIPKPPPPLVLKSREEIDDKSFIVLEQDQAVTINFLALQRRLYNNDVLEIRLPLAAVSESASYASHFMALTGLLSILAGSVWAFLFAKKFTVPLLELSQVAQSISQLDFSQKCNISSADEVGKLGNSINNLSLQLNKAISELNHRNQQLMADVEKERRLDKLRKNFISSVSHELKTPISLILGYAEGLRENVAHDEDSKNYYCSVIVDEAEKMDHLVKDLLDLSQIESGYFRLEKTNFDLSLLLDDIAAKYQGMLQERNIRLTIEKEAPVLATGDELRIEQVIVNLLNNAIDHAENMKIIQISIIQGKNKLRICIDNTGKHIPDDSLNNLWLSFYKVDNARTRGLGGYGLGLSIVRAIQELHGNAYGVENIDGGVRFWFEIDKAS
jgi:signal transduction histidine kinase